MCALREACPTEGDGPDFSSGAPILTGRVQHDVPKNEPNPVKKSAIPAGRWHCRKEGPFLLVLFFWASKRKEQMLLKRRKRLIIRCKKHPNNFNFRCYCPFFPRYKIGAGIDEKRTKKIKAVFKSNDFAKIYGGAKPNSTLLRRVSNMVLLNPPPISQNRDLNKAGPNSAWRF
jgi:hypothetical protein